MYAIVKLVGKQFRVEKGDTLVVDRLEAEVDKTFTVNEVLFVSDGKKSQVGTPLVEKASVEFKVLDHNKAKKIRVAKYRSKSRYRKVMGHRQYQTLLEVTAIKA